MRCRFYFIVKVNTFEVPPPGAGFVTVTWAVPALATSDFKICAASLPALW
jgi:hypothetical protein